MFIFNKIAKLFLFFFFLLIVFYITNSISNGFKTQYTVFDDSAGQLISRSEELIKKSVYFDEDNAIRNFQANRDNGFFYRFDDNLRDARFVGDIASSTTKNDDILFEFNEDKSNLSLKPLNNDFIVENGILKYHHSPSNILESVKELNIIPDSIGEINLRIKTQKTEQFLLTWSDDPASKNTQWGGSNSLTIWTVPDNKFHNYNIDVQSVLKAFLKDSERIKKIFFHPVDSIDDSIEIDYFRFLSKWTKYSQKDYDVVHEKINNELRRVIYSYSSSALKFNIALPDNDIKLKFGMGLLENDAPVKFEVSITEGDQQAVIFSKLISDTNNWHDAEIDLSPYTNKNIEILFSTRCESRNIVFWSNPLLYSLPHNRFNVIIALEDSLRADRLSCYGNPKITTPVKDAFAKAGVIFSNAYSQATYTRASCASLMTSLYPGATGVWDPSETLDENYLTLPEIMRSQGFATASFTQNSHAGPYAGLHQGFSTVLDKERVGLRADHIYGGQEMEQWLENNADRNFFLYLHLIDPHGPYDPPDDYASEFKKTYQPGPIRMEKSAKYDPGWIKAPTIESRNFLYEAEIQYNDSCFEKLLTMLKSKKIFENTMIIFISDHGEHFAEHYFLWDHIPPGYVQVLHVPMIMVYPKKLPAGKIIHQSVQLLDIMPTILSTAGINYEHLILQGNSLIPLINGYENINWTDRICISEEVVYKRQNPNVYGSLFYRNLHILNSEDLNDKWSRKLKGYSEDLFLKLLTTRTFDMSYDKSEHYDLFFYLIDFNFKHKVNSFMQEFRTNNLQIWNALKSPEHQKKTIKYDPAMIEQLKGLGYIN